MSLTTLSSKCDDKWLGNYFVLANTILASDYNLSLSDKCISCSLGVCYIDISSSIIHGVSCSLQDAISDGQGAPG